MQGAEDFDANPGSGLTDMYVQPINLGWTTPRADITAAYGLFLPTGRYEDGANNNTGLGMVGQELLLGTTVYLNEQRSLHVATAATFDFFSEKKDSETKVGNILNLEGGVGADFLKGGLTAGLAYYGTLQADRGPVRLAPGVAADPGTRIECGGWDPRSRSPSQRSRRSTASSPCATSGSSPRERRPRARPGTSWRRSR